MFEVLERAIGEADIPLDASALRQALFLLDRFTAKVTAAAAAFDAHQLWDLEGATSMTAWLRDQGGKTRADAARLSRTGRRLRSCPVTAAAWADGTLSGGQVAAVLANLNDDTTPMFTEQEAELIPTLAGLPVEDVATVMSTWRARAEALVDKPEPPEPDRSVHLSTHLDGRGALSGDLDAETTEVLRTALREAETPDIDGEPSRSPARRRADALAAIARFFLDHHQTAPVGSRHRPHVNLLVDLDARLAGDPAAGGTVDGIVLSPETVARILCDCGVHRVVTKGGSTILDYGRTTRTIPAPLFNSLVVRDRHCRWPGCDRPPSWCEGHHVRHWEHGGPTDLSNLVLLCSRHHHRAHTPGWHVKLEADASFTVTTDNGKDLTSRPPPRC